MLKYVLAAAGTLASTGCVIDMGGTAEARPAPVDWTAADDPGPVEARSFPLAGFDAIELAGCDRVAVTLGNRFAVNVTGPARDLALLRARVNGSTLVLDRMKKGCDGKHTQLTYAVTLPALTQVAISGAGAVDLPAITGDRFRGEISGAGSLGLAGLTVDEARFAVSGAGEIMLTDVTARHLRLDQSGAGEIVARGTAQSLAIDSSGAGEIDTTGLAAATLTAEASGTGVVRASASGSAKLDASGMARIAVTGGVLCTIETSGMARATCD
ncbi:hypothetical protein GCM10022600_09720 [Qipengyuania pelagi]|uniref:Putative auto-transporter adhesin head GIN domain-containing protein n=1 Tax=Qipengyuania pelagi TaxID=994320 RepID=A0A844YA74_9SPHN|nr:DUF2807 domain-containing protein [Qipengyuania pelagi]MXO54153.1 hypothetical protein [Qipengyuania pelagi]